MGAVEAADAMVKTANVVLIGKEYLLMVQDGVIAAQYMRSWQAREGGAVLLAPAYTFLMSNYPVDYQFWLDAGSSGWFERLFQPLTHPYVLGRGWPQSANRDLVWHQLFREAERPEEADREVNEAADAAKAFEPKILYPYHYGQTDPNRLIDLLKDSKTEVRIRKMK